MTEAIEIENPILPASVKQIRSNPNSKFTREETIERKAKGDYKTFIESATENFIDNFTYDIDCRITPKLKQRTWIINEEKFLRLKNIFIKTLQEELAKEDLRVVESEANKKIQELKELIDNAKDDLNYITEAANRKVGEEY